jgi:translation initiation factor 2 subunit 3
MIKIHTFYGIDSPKIEEYVVAKVTKFVEGGGYFVDLPEYNNIEGFVGLKDVTTTKFRKLKGLVKLGSTEVMKVEKISGKHIDLTRKCLDQDLTNERMSKYLSYRSIYNWMIAKSDIYNIELINNYISEVIQKDNEFLQNAKDIKVSDEYKLLHENIAALIASKCIEEKYQSIEETLAHLAKINVDTINNYLKYIRENFEVDIHIQNTRKSIYRISSLNRIKEDEFQAILDNIKNVKIETIESKQNYSQDQDENKQQNYSQNQPQVNIGIIGHVSHGKTTLIQSMTGIDTRRHKEEIQSNRTLKLGYTNMTIYKCICNQTNCNQTFYKTYSECKCEKIDISIIDCPGHNVLLSTMIAGSHLMDAALLLVALNEKFPQIQTEEHLNVVGIVDRINDIIVIQNKLDLVKKEEAYKQKEEIENYLVDYNVKRENIIPISAQKDINIQYVLENLYNLSQKIIKEKSLNENGNNGLIVRTFDINKPGDKDVKGLVLGGSVMNGKFKIGDSILVMPQKIRGTIKSIKSDKNNLCEAKSGGLIAIQTDINPVYCDGFIGSSFILQSEFREENLIQTEQKIKIKYYPLKEKKLKKGHKILINILAKDIECDVVKISKEKNKCTIQLSKPIYIFDKFSFVITKDKRLFGYGTEISTEIQKVYTEQYLIPNLYENMIENFTNDYKERHAPKAKTILPLPKIQYVNTFSTINNFEDYCKVIKTSPDELGKFIYTEQGFKSWSVNSKNQLIVKGRISDNVFMNNIVKFCSDKLCNRCKSLDTEQIIDRGVKKLSCNECNWSEPTKR